MAIHARKYEPPKNSIKDGEISVNALITPRGKYIDVGIWSRGEEGTNLSVNIQIPTEIIEREMAKF